MKTRESTPEFRIKLGKGLNYLAIWLFAPSIKIAEDFDYDTSANGIIRFELDMPSRFSLKDSKHGWSFSFRVLGLGTTVSRVKV